MEKSTFRGKRKQPFKKKGGGGWGEGGEKEEEALKDV